MVHSASISISTSILTAVESQISSDLDKFGWIKVCNRCSCDDSSNPKLILLSRNIEECKRHCEVDLECRGVEFWKLDAEAYCSKCFDLENTCTQYKHDDVSVYKKGFTISKIFFLEKQTRLGTKSFSKSILAKLNKAIFSPNHLKL